MSRLDTICKFNYNTGQAIRISHSLPIIRSQVKLQKIIIPSLFTPSTCRPEPAVKASILCDPPTVLTRKRYMALPSPEKNRNVAIHWKKGLLILYYQCLKLQTQWQRTETKLYLHFTQFDGTDDNLHMLYHSWKHHRNQIHFLIMKLP